MAAAALPAYAQSGAVLSGVVLGPNGSPMAGVAVQVAGNGLRFEQRSDSQGGFSFQALPLGTYAVRATAMEGVRLLTSTCRVKAPP